MHNLDRHAVTHQVGSFFGFNFLGCLLTIVFQNVTTCTTSETLHLVAFLMWLAVLVGINVIGAKSWGLSPSSFSLIKLPSPTPTKALTIYAIATCWSEQQS
jgi:hypothetical protein